MSRGNLIAATISTVAVSVGSACGGDRATKPDGPTVVRGQAVHSARDGGQPYGSCDLVELPPMRLADAEGGDTWVVATTGRPLAKVTITIGINADDRARIGEGPNRVLEIVPCPL